MGGGPEQLRSRLRLGRGWAEFKDAFSLCSFLSWVGGRVSEKLPRLRVPLCGKANWFGASVARSFCHQSRNDRWSQSPSLTLTPSGDVANVYAIIGSFRIFLDRSWASLRLGTNARLPPKWHVCISVCSLRCARRLSVQLRVPCKPPPAGALRERNRYPSRGRTSGSLVPDLRSRSFSSGLLFAVLRLRGSGQDEPMADGR